MEPYLSDSFYNPSATYLAAKRVRQDLDLSRAKIAAWLGAKQYEIYFTAGATEANNLAIQGVMHQFPDGEILVSAIEHDSVLMPAGLFNSQLVPVTDQGIVDLGVMQKLITPKTILVSVMLVNNELGTIQPIKEIARLVREERARRLENKIDRPIYLHTDAAQAGNLIDLHVSRLGVDLMSIKGGKIYGPKQSGVLFVNSNVEIRPLIIGGGQELNLRSGTENVAGFIGLAKALDLAQKRHAKEFKRLSDLRKKFIDEMSELPLVTINGSKKHQSPHIVSITFAGQDNERLMMELDEAGLQVAVGSACSASSDEPSHVLAAIGLPEKNIYSTLRVSFGRQTSEADIDRLVVVLKKLLS